MTSCHKQPEKRAETDETIHWEEGWDDWTGTVVTKSRARRGLLGPAGDWESRNKENKDSYDREDMKHTEETATTRRRKRFPLLN